MIPLKEMVEDFEGRRPIAWVTIAMIVVCAWTWLVIQPPVGTSNADMNKYLVEKAAVPCEIWRNRQLSTAEYKATFVDRATTRCSDGTGPVAVVDKHVYRAVIVSVFLHSGFFHLAFNCLFLWIFGRRVEAAFKWHWYAVFLLAGGVISTLGFAVVEPNSSIPIIGASGAIAAVMGVYLVLYPNIRVVSLFFVFPFVARAWYFLMLWILGQFWIDKGTNVAKAAHLVGFGLGVAVGLWLRFWPKPRRSSSVVPVT